MNRLAIALVVSAAAFAASSAHADSRVRIGVSVGSPSYYTPAPVAVYAPAPTVVYAPPPTAVVAPARGYWTDVQVRTWVPERWMVRTNRWGRAERFCEPGHYVYHTERIWVDGRPDHRPGYAYNDRRW